MCPCFCTSSVLDLLEQSTEARDRVEANTKYFRDAMTGAGCLTLDKDGASC